MRVLVGISGASGAAVALAALRRLSAAGVEVHLVVSRWGEVTLRHECDARVRDIAEGVAAVHANGDMAAPVASGSYPLDAVLVVPCSVRTMGAIAAGTGDSLIARAADVALKSRRRLVLGVREAPWSLIHLRNAQTVTEAGGVIYPLTPAFYAMPPTVDDLVDDLAGRLVDMCGVPTDIARWGVDLAVRDRDIAGED